MIIRRSKSRLITQPAAQPPGGEGTMRDGIQAEYLMVVNMDFTPRCWYRLTCAVLAARVSSEWVIDIESVALDCLVCSYPPHHQGRVIA